MEFGNEKANYLYMVVILLLILILKSPTYLILKRIASMYIAKRLKHTEVLVIYEKRYANNGIITLKLEATFKVSPSCLKITCILCAEFLTRRT